MTGNARKDEAGRVAHYHSLGGCVNDVALLECFLKDEVGVPADHIFKLTSSTPDNPKQNTPLEHPSIWPTYKNIRQTFLSLSQTAQKDDLVYIHYSGHGARVRTAFETLKGPDGIDEALVPIDIEVQQETQQGKYVRDIELADWLQGLVSKQLHVTIVLDCCHAGSSNRAYGHSVRGTGHVDLSLLPSDHNSIPLSSGLLASSHVSRSGAVKKNWLLEASGYTLLAASTAFQKAHERYFGDRKHGVLTYYLVDALRSETASARPSLLLSRISAKIQSHYTEQTPIMDGEDQEYFFGMQGHRQNYDIRVLNVNMARKVIELDHGGLHGVHLGAEYTILSPSSSIGNSGSDNVVAKVKITEVMGLKSIATFSNASQQEQNQVHAGFRASLLKEATREQLIVRILQPDADFSDERHQTWLEEFQTHVSQRQATFQYWTLLSDDKLSDNTDFFVSITDEGCYALLDESRLPIPNLSTVQCTDPRSVAILSQFINHMARFRLVQRLRADVNSGLKEPCKFEISGWSNTAPLQPALGDFSGELTYPSGLGPAMMENGEFMVSDGDVVNVLFENQGTAPVFFALFDLKPLWGVEKIYPAGGGWSECVEPKGKRNLPIIMEIPEPLIKLGVSEIKDTFKAIVTLRSTPLRMLEIPDIKQFGAKDGETDAQRTGLDHLANDIFQTNRTPKLKGRYSGTWQAYDIVIRTTRTR